MWPGQALSLKVDSVLFEGKSDFQSVLVFESSAYGRVLVLDGAIQLTQRDEFAYQACVAEREDSAQPAKRVLVIGGGDGGVVREVARHTSVELIECAEIDAMVPEVSRKYFPEVAMGFEDKRVLLKICDGLKFVEDAVPDTYDVIIVDSSDPIGPASVLFSKGFFQNLHKALRPGGIICTQGESLWLHIGLIKDCLTMCKEVFGTAGHVSYAFCTIPSYPSGQIGFLLCTKAGGTTDVREPVHPAPDTDSKPLRYYDADVHKAAFVLPKFARAELSPLMT